VQAFEKAVLDTHPGLAEEMGSPPYSKAAMKKFSAAVMDLDRSKIDA